MSTLDDLKKAAIYIQPALIALETIQKLTKVGGDKASAALAAIDAVVRRFALGVNNGATAEEILEEIALLHGSIANNDAAADSALDAKFRTP